MSVILRKCVSLLNGPRAEARDRRASERQTGAKENMRKGGVQGGYMVNSRSGQRTAVGGGK
jgi:hypothetical protein